MKLFITSLLIFMMTSFNVTYSNNNTSGFNVEYNSAEASAKKRRKKRRDYRKKNRKLRKQKRVA